MTPTDPVRELERRTAAGEVAPLADPAGHGNWHRSFHDFPFFGADARAAAAARRQLRLRLKLGVDRRPCDPLLAAFRKRCVERGGERDGLGSLLPEDSLAAVILLLPDLRFEETLCALADDLGPIPENLFARSRTVGDLLSGLVPRERETEADDRPESAEVAEKSAPADHRVRRYVFPLLVLAVFFLLALAFGLYRRAVVDRRRAFEEWQAVSVLCHLGQHREAWERLHPELQARKPFAEFAAGFTNDWFQPGAFGAFWDERRDPSIPSRFLRSDGGRQLQFFVWKRRLWKPRWLPEWDDDETDGCMIPEITMKKDGDDWKVADWCTHCR